MKKLQAGIFLLLCFAAGLARAGEFVIGQQQFTYSVPPNYIEMQKGKSRFEDMQISYIESALGIMGSSLLTVIIEKDLNYLLLRLGFPIEDYAVVSQVAAVSDIRLTEEDFKKLKESIRVENINEMLQKKKSKLDDFSRKQFGMELGIALSLKPQVLEQSDTVFSYLIPVAYELGSETMPTLVLTNMILLEGKLVIVTYYKHYKNEEDVGIIKQNSAAFLAGLNLRSVPQAQTSAAITGGSAQTGLSAFTSTQTSNGIQAEQSSGFHTSWYFVGGGALLLALFALYQQTRNKRKKTGSSHE